MPPVAIRIFGFSSAAPARQLNPNKTARKTPTNLFMIPPLHRICYCQYIDIPWTMPTVSLPFRLHDDLGYPAFLADKEPDRNEKDRQVEPQNWNEQAER